MRSSCDRHGTDAPDPSTVVMDSLTAKGAKSAKARVNPLGALGALRGETLASNDPFDRIEGLRLNPSRTVA